ncbi:hypothetical protein [Paraburkholderia sp.]|uniref:hypothetical protein n=1 Tax=Paraburkholderia sp. TaxID=1926495 RepID=UPI0039C8DE52
MPVGHQEGVRRVMRVDDRQVASQGTRVDARREVSQRMRVDARREVSQGTRVDGHREVSQETRVDARREVNPGTRVDGHQEVSPGTPAAVRQVVASHLVMQEAGHLVVMATQVDARRAAMAVAARKVAVAVPRVEETAAEAEVTGNRISAVNPCNGTGGQGSGQDASTRLSLIRVPQRREVRAEPV